MKMGNLLAGLLSGAATAAITFAVLMPSNLDANTEKPEIKPPISSPALKVDGCEITLQADDRTFKADDKPTVTLKAVNNTDHDATISVNVKMLGVSPGSEMSRVGPIPKEMWQVSCPLVIKAGQTKDMSLDTKTTIGKLSRVYFEISSGDKSLSDLSLKIEKPAAAKQEKEVQVTAATTR